MFATAIEKTLGRCCSSSEALLPADLASSNSCAAFWRSWIRATTALSPTRMRIPWTAERVDPGKTYFAWIGTSPWFSYTWVIVTSAITPLMLAVTFVDLSGNDSVPGFAPSTKKYGERTLLSDASPCGPASAGMVKSRSVRVSTVRIASLLWARIAGVGPTVRGLCEANKKAGCEVREERVFVTYIFVLAS